MSLAKSINSAIGNFGWQQQSQFGRVRFDLFFDRQKVMSRLDRKEKRVLGGTGSFTRGFMRRLFRPGGKKGKQSSPGEPPRYHTRGFASLKDGVFFHADLDKGSVVIGPNKLRTQVSPTGGAASTAELLDKGGRGTITSYRHNKNRPGKLKRRIGRWRARPFTRKSLIAGDAKMRELMEKVDL